MGQHADIGWTQRDAADGDGIAAMRAKGLHVIVEDTRSPTGRTVARVAEDAACIPHAYGCAIDAFVALHEILSKGPDDARGTLRVVGPDGDETHEAHRFGAAQGYGTSIAA